MAEQTEQTELVFWLPAINPYWAKRLSALHASGRVSFTCWFNRPRGPGREWTVPEADLAFPHVFLPARPVARYREAARLAWRHRPRHVLTFHFMPELWPALVTAVLPGRRLAFYAEKTFDAWVTRSPAKERLKRVLFSGADVVFAPGPDAVRYIRRYRRRGPIGRLPHVLDLPAFAPARAAREPAGDLRLLYLGRFIPEKGLTDLMRAIDDLGPDSSVSLHVVGGGPLREQLETWAAEAPVPVRVDPFVQQADLLPVLVDADVLVFPTYGDPYGLVVSEAMAAGLTVISSTEAGEIEQRLTDGPEAPRGVVVPVRDASALTAAVKGLAADRETLVAMQSAAATHADREFDLGDWVTAIESWVLDGRLDTRDDAG